MFARDQYELLDFGGGRKLERFGGVVLDRPAPLARGRRHHPRRWTEVHARFDRPGPGRAGTWNVIRPFEEPWTVSWQDHMTLELKRNAHGHIGLFAEQASNWQWLVERIRGSMLEAPVLNLFAYSGGSTLAAASVGASVTHVDASASVVRRAKRNAQRSGLEEAPIRWIVDDAVRFTQREVRRGRRYGGIILDPPAYGHGTGARTWQLKRDLPRLIELCHELLEGSACFFLLTCHVRDWRPEDLRRYLSDRTSYRWTRTTRFERLELRADHGRSLEAGLAAKWHP